MNPYERTAEEMKRQSEGPKRFAKTALGVGSAIGAASFAPILSRTAPLLSQYIPEDLAIKGLSKISPRFGTFIKDAMDGGYDFNQIKDFIGEQIKGSNEESAKDNRNIIEQYSPELHQFIKDSVGKGVSHVQAGAEAQKNPKFSNIIKKLMKDHKTSWNDILEQIYGGEISRQEGLGKFNQRSKKPSMIEEERERFERGYGQQQQQESPAKQQLLQAMQNLSQQLRQ